MSTLDFPSTDTVVKTASSYARDLAERVVATFLQAFLAGVTVTTPFDLSMWKAAALAGVAAGYALIKGLAARFKDLRNSASLAKGV